ncbi:MAG: hypothetical protein M1825_004448 [Sarcosagium campestre]|nr:MAG: hypothetical protein M1825_004448 [Sarcosagium campestre]
MASSSQAVAKRSTDSALMPPPPKRIKRPAQVLDEDTYTDALSTIVARDFFPGLLETHTQQEYLDALESDNRAWIASAGRRLTQLMTPGSRRGRRGTSLATPRPSDTPTGYGGDTPMSVVSGVSTTSTATQAPEVDINMSLDNFQAKYTSEDNESFNKLLDKQNLKKAQKYAWLRGGNQIASARQIKQREREGRLLEAKQAQEREDGGRQLLSIEGSDERKAIPDGWNARVDNQLMFEPEGIEDHLESVQQHAELISKAGPKGVAYDNTRFPPPAPTADADSSVPPSPSLSAVRDVLAGRPRPTDSEPGYSGGDTPRVNGYAFVDDEPTPSELGIDSNERPARLQLGAGDATPNPFKLGEQSKRESLHHRMVDRVAKNSRSASRQGAVGRLDKTPTPKFASSPRTAAGNLTPAAQRLLSRVGSPAIRGGTGSFGDGLGPRIGKMSRKGESSGLRFGWTPTPRAQRGKD